MEENNLLSIISSVITLLLVFYMYINYMDQFKEINGNLREIKIILMEKE